MPDAPSAEEVAAAIEPLSDVVSDFPFKDASSKSAWLASVLTPLVRDAHGDRDRSSCTVQTIAGRARDYWPM